MHHKQACTGQRTRLVHVMDAMRAYKNKKMKFVACLALFSGQASAEVDDQVKQGRVLLDKRQAKQVFELLEPQEAARAGDPDVDTTMGIAANDNEQFTREVFALERVLSVQPENSRARAELGRAPATFDMPKASTSA